MTEPKLEPFAPDVLEALSVEKAAPGPSADVLDRLGGRIAAAIGGPGGPGGSDPGGAGGDAAPTDGGSTVGDGGASLADVGSTAAGSLSAGATEAITGAGGLLASIAAKPVILATTMFAVGAATGAGVYSAVDRPKAAPSSQPALVVAVADAGAVEIAVVPDAIDGGAAVPEPEVRTEPRQEQLESKPQPTARRAGDRALAAERTLLELCRTALVRGDGTTSLAHIRKHARKYPRGRLAEERDALWVQALVQVGDYDRAASKAARFRQRYPKSMFLPIVEDAARKIP